MLLGLGILGFVISILLYIIERRWDSPNARTLRYGQVVFFLLGLAGLVLWYVFEVYILGQLESLG